MFDLKRPRRRRLLRSRVSLARRFPFSLGLVLLLALAGCAWKKKPVQIAAPAATPPPTPAMPATPATPAQPAAPSPAAPSAPQAPPVPKQSVVGKVLSLVTLAPSPLNLKATIAASANNNSPVELDVVLIKDKGFWKTAPSMSAKDWFAQKDDLERRYRSKLVVSSWEWVPGQHIDPLVIRVPRWLNGAMVFASYPSPGTHSAPLPKGGKVSVSLQDNDFTLEAPQ